MKQSISLLSTFRSSKCPSSLQVIRPNVFMESAYLVKSTNYEDPYCTFFSASCLFLPLRSKYSPQHPVLKLPCWRTRLASVLYSSLLYVLMFRVVKTDGKTNNFELHDSKHSYYLICFNFLVNTVLICCHWYCFFQIFDL